MANFCSECKTENSEKSKFCSSCGTALVITQSKMTSFPDAIKLFFRRCFDFRGRSTRAEYWWAILFLILVSLVLAGIDALIGTFDSELGIGFLGAFGGLVKTYFPGNNNNNTGRVIPTDPYRKRILVLFSRFVRILSPK